MEISQELLAYLPEIIRWRRALHQLPELGLEEFATTAYLKNELLALGYTDIRQPLATGLVVVIESEQPGKTIAYRSDIDALPVTEETGADFASPVAGRMHACGHDGHMATLLGFAKYLAEHPNARQGRIVLIFQPAEEGPGGAQLLIDTGLFTELAIEEIIGLHVFPEFDEGVIACRPGGMMARNGEVTITVTGCSAHGAQPQQGQDALLAMSAVVQALHTVISRNLSPMDAAVLTFGKIYGGEAMNIIPGAVTIEGTMRAFSDEVYETMVARIEAIATGVASGYGCQAEVVFNHMYRVVDNHPPLVDKLVVVAGDSYVETPPYMLAEDFSMYQQVVPGLFFFVGIRNEEKGWKAPLHSGKMQFDERALLFGLQCYVDLLPRLNQG